MQQTGTFPVPFQKSRQLHKTRRNPNSFSRQGIYLVYIYTAQKTSGATPGKKAFSGEL